MLSRLNLRELLRLGFPVCAWVSLALFVFAVSGLPVPVPYAKDLSRAFPCMFHSCGCRDAQQCWNHCCCHSASERLAWAKAHHVRPPDALTAAVQSEGRDVKCETAGRSACCRTKKAATVSLLAALKCRGAGDLVAGVPMCLPPPHADWQLALPLPAALQIAIQPAATWVESPPVPPPRHAHS